MGLATVIFFVRVVTAFLFPVKHEQDDCFPNLALLQIADNISAHEEIKSQCDKNASAATFLSEESFNTSHTVDTKP